jgi:hypothetical protein
LRPVPIYITSFLILCFFCLISLSSALAQGADTLQNNGKLPAPDISQENERLQQTYESQDSTIQKNIEFYDKVKAFFYRKKALRKIYDAVFRDPYKGAPPVIPDNSRGKSYAQHNGKIIREVKIKKLDVFGPSVNDTARVNKTLVGRIGNNLHINTRKFIIRQDLFFKEGSIFIAEDAIDNERILRQRPNLLDARIIPIPTDHPDSIDVLVITQDIWSISGDGSLSGSVAGRANLSDKNIFGLGHELRNTVIYDSRPGRGWAYLGGYRIPYIGRTFITGHIEYIDHWDRRYAGLKLNRQFITPTTKYAGGFEVSRQRLYGFVHPLDTASLIFPFSYNMGDIWLGRSFPTKIVNRTFQESARLIVAGRITGLDFIERPQVSTDTNQLYLNRLTFLTSIGISDRQYYRDVMIYGFGRTEDVPYGTLFNITTGVETNEFGHRIYTGFELGQGRYRNNFGYLAWNINVGTFLRGRKAEQGAFVLTGRYFSKLFILNRMQLRQFVTFRFLHGLNRFNGEIIDINNHNGITGISSIAMRGNQRAVLNLETVLFTPFNILGFRTAIFTFADLGLIPRSDQKFFQGPLYHGYGLGVRVRNEHLAFNTFQFRIGYYLNVPITGIPLRASFEGIPLLRISDFDIGAPEVVPYR